jgi:hypothetical protein
MSAPSVQVRTNIKMFSSPSVLFEAGHNFETLSQRFFTVVEASVFSASGSHAEQRPGGGTCAEAGAVALKPSKFHGRTHHFSGLSICA